MTWCFVIMGNSYDIKYGQWRADANTLLNAQEFWFAVFMTILYVFLHLCRSYYSYSIVFSSLGLPFERFLWKLKL